LLETSYVSQELHDTIHTAVVCQVPRIISDEETYYNTFSRVVCVIVSPNVLDLRELYLVLLTQLKQLIFELCLSFHNVHIGSLLSLAFQLEKERIVHEIFDGLLIVSEIEVGVDECHAEVEVLKERVNHGWV
jgi:hypothetical protein